MTGAVAAGLSRLGSTSSAIARRFDSSVLPNLDSPALISRISSLPLLPPVAKRQKRFDHPCREPIPRFCCFAFASRCIKH